MSNNKIIDQSTESLETKPELELSEENLALAADLSQEINSNRQVKKDWFEKYSGQPLSFFDDDNLLKLKEMGSRDRLSALACAAESLQITNERVKKYYALFPDDLAIVERHCQDRAGQPDANSTWALWNLSYPFMKNCQCEWVDNGDFKYPCGKYENIAAISERRRQAPTRLLSGFSDLEVENFEKFGPAAKGFSDLLNDIRVPDFQKESFVEPRKMLSADFLALAEEEKAAFLRQALACLHDEKVWQEVYNSGFLPGFSRFISKNNSPIHSVVFQTEHSNSFYKNEGIFLYSLDSSAERGGFIEENAIERTLLQVIESLGQLKAEPEKNIDTLLEFWNKNRNPLFSGAVARALSAQDPNLAVAKLIPMLKEEKNNKNFLTAMLYRLEFGQINISEAGVSYLQKVYDLGEYNNPNYHASRLTGDGEIGIFDEESELIKYFELGDLQNQEKTVKAKVLDFTYETLFIGRPDESEGERVEREKYLAEFKKNYSQIAGDKIFETTGVKLNNLSFKEQGWFIKYFSDCSEEDREALRTFVGHQREEGIKTFLAMEIDENLSQKIIDLDRNLSADAARALFLKLASVVDLAGQEADALKEHFLTSAEPKNIDWQAVRRALLQRLKQLILEADCHSAREASEMISGLERVKADMIFFAAVMKNVRETEKDLDWNLIRDLNLSIKDYGEELGQKEKDEVINMSRINWEGYGNKKMADVVQNGLELALADDRKQRAYILKYKDEVIAFVRFEKKMDETIHAGSFNVSKDLRGLSIGNEMMEKALIMEGVDNVLEATASIKIPVGCSYVEKIGFVAEGVINDYHGTGESLFTIRLDSAANKKYVLRSEGGNISPTLKDLQSEARKSGELDKLMGRESIILRFDLKTEMADYEKALNRLLPKADDNGQLLESKKDKYTLTRYFYDKEEDPKASIRYLAFEKNH